jgi:DNA-binding protein H-NS
MTRRLDLPQTTTARSGYASSWRIQPCTTQFGRDFANSVANDIQQGVENAAWEATVKKKDLAMMSIDELWSLHEKVRTTLSTKLDSEKQELERRLALLNGRAADKPEARRPYPKVHPKYRNPERPSETWSGRGRQPHWVGAQLRSGKKVDDLLIVQTH